MNMNRYQELAARTMNPNLTPEQTLRHALFEIASETGEILGIFQKELQGHKVNREDLVLEMGDLLWGIAELCTALGVPMNTVAYENIQKLFKRYPDGFTQENSVNRPENN